MTYESHGPLVTTEWLAKHLSDRNLIVADIRWDASAVDAGVKAYTAGHIPGAVYVDLDTELADRSDLSRGRHPLPDPQIFVEALARHGIGQDTTMVVYDDKAGSLAARLWWMMRWISAPAALVLDGGFTKWVVEGRPVESGPGRKPLPHPHPHVPRAHSTMVADFFELEDPEENLLLLDARAPERYRGEVEPTDARAGHIPGAINAPWMNNVSSGQEQIFKTADELRSQFEVLGIREDSDVVASCGSGVTACHNLLAMEIAGLHGARLYPGSWSEWIAKKE